MVCCILLMIHNYHYHQNLFLKKIDLLLFDNQIQGAYNEKVPIWYVGPRPGVASGGIINRYAIIYSIIIRKL